VSKKVIIIVGILFLVFLGAFLVFKNIGRFGEVGEKIKEGKFLKTQEQKQEESSEGIFTQADLEKAKEIAQRAVENSPTYKFDGFDLKFLSSEKLDCQGCFEFTFSFKSRHPGYGNRSGKVLAQVITSHEAKVNLQGEKVVSLVTDGTFDELRETFIK